ncbi:MAG: T9SS type A sorting domain-containing protein [Ignavibacteria bacterium]|nr:T9SS type A sorting domain-containing protein [Ignavibacteria bacterium]
MSKTFTLIILLLIINLQKTSSQPWHYDFGTGTGSYSTASGVSYAFLPSPPTDSIRIRMGSAGGSFNLENQEIPFGTGSYLRIVAPTSTSVNKFSVYKYSPGKSFTIRFKVRLGSSNGSNTAGTGNFYFFAGLGGCFYDNAQFNGAQIFTGLRFVFGSSGAITTSFRSGSSWLTSGITGTPFQQAQDFIVEIYGNNTAGTLTYVYGTTQNVAANKWDLWVNGILVGDDLAKALLSNDANIDSWMFYGENSTGNAANIFLDEFDYHNDLAGTPLPVTMGSFNLYGNDRSAALSWSTTSELNNSGFEIERSNISGTTTDGWLKIAFVKGNGTTTEPKNYSYNDNNLKAGSYKYRLKQTDYNGNFEYFTPANAEYVTIVKPNEFSLSQNYPNPSNPVCKIDYQLPFAGIVNITVFDVTGKAVKELVNGFQAADYYSVTFDGSGLASGIYFYRINGSSENLVFTKTMKMVLVK